MKRTYDPILSITEPRRMRVGAIRTPRMGTALVLEPSTGGPLLVRAGERVPDARIGNYTRAILVDVAPYGLAFSTRAPSADPAFPFTVTLNFGCRVHNPVAIARDNVRDMTESLRPSLTHIVREVARRHDILDIGGAEAAIAAELHGAVAASAVALTGFAAELDAGDTTQLLQVRADLRVQEMKTAAARPLVEGGITELLAAAIGNAGGSVDGVLDRIGADQNARIAERVAVAQLLAGADTKGDPIDPTRLVEAVREIVGESAPVLAARPTSIRERIERKLAPAAEVAATEVDAKVVDAEHTEAPRRPSRLRGTALEP